jgi:DNA-binding transcriptional MerR regulator
MRIGEVAGRAGVPAKTIRFWEERSLLPLPARTSAGYRDYDPAVLKRIAFIQQAQVAGLTLDAIGQPPSLSCRLYRDADGRLGPAPSAEALRHALATVVDG